MYNDKYIMLFAHKSIMPSNGKSTLDISRYAFKIELFMVMAPFETTGN